MEKEKIEVVKTWSELKSVMNILVFIDFVNFYYHCFNKIAIPLTLILKIIPLVTLQASNYAKNVNLTINEIKSISINDARDGK